MSNLTGFFGVSSGDDDLRRLLLKVEPESGDSSNLDPCEEEAGGDKSESFTLFSPAWNSATWGSVGERQVGPDSVLLAVEEDKVIACTSRGMP